MPLSYWKPAACLLGLGAGALFVWADARPLAGHPVCTAALPGDGPPRCATPAGSPTTPPPAQFPAPDLKPASLPPPPSLPSLPTPPVEKKPEPKVEQPPKPVPPTPAPV